MSALSRHPACYLLARRAPSGMIYHLPQDVPSENIDPTVRPLQADDPIRTSYGATVTARDDRQLIADIDEKIAHLSMLPPENSEQLQVGTGAQALT